MQFSFDSLNEKIENYSRKDAEKILAAANASAKKTAIDLPRRMGAAWILAELKMDAETLIACFDDSPLAANAKKLSAIAEVNSKNAGEAKERNIAAAENIIKMIFAAADDIRAVIIALAFELALMRKPEFIPEDARRVVAQNALAIFAPLADRLGISSVKAEIEDLALKEINGAAYRQIKEIVASKRGERKEFLDAVSGRLAKEAKAANLAVEVESRAKHFYSIYLKMRKRNKAPGDLFDLFGLRLLCNDVDACYTLLGLVHRLWKPVDGRFKDYIASPKANGYRSLHTTVTVDGKMLEIQIRSFEMHRVAEYGIAGHWLYKQGRRAEKAGGIGIINKLKSTLAQIGDAGEKENGGAQFLADLKRGYLKNSIYVFTPMGKVIALPEGATALDFAYQIHSAVGDRCMAAKADGAIIPLSAPLHNAQTVEIVTANNARPHQNWLNIVKTAKARNKIRAWLEANEADKALSKKEKKSAKIPATDTKTVVETKAGEGKPAGDKIDDKTETKIFRTGTAFKIVAGSEKNMLVRYARCCNPVAGDEITGYVSRGRGIIIHKKNCPNLDAIPPERFITVEWEGSALPLRRFAVEARETKGDSSLFAEIEGAVRKFSGHLVEGKLEESGSGIRGTFTMQLENADDAAKILRHIRGIPAVQSIRGLG